MSPRNNKPSTLPEELEQFEGLFTDLSPYLDGKFVREVPTVARVFGNKCLLYARRINEVHAEPGCGKSQMQAAAIIEVLKAIAEAASDDGCVIVIEPEDGPDGFCNRLLALGADKEIVRKRVKYLNNPNPEGIQNAVAWAKYHKVVLVILDGLAQSLADHDFDENSVLDVLKFFKIVLRPFANSGAAVLVADHVVKNSTGSRWGRGTGAKLGHYDGLVLELKQVVPFTPEKSGHLSLTISKDRRGGAGFVGQHLANLHFEPVGHDRTAYRWEAMDPNTKWVPTEAMRRILTGLIEAEKAGKILNATDAKAVGVKKEYADKALVELVAVQLVIWDKTSRPHQVTITDKGRQWLAKETPDKKSEHSIDLDDYRRPEGGDQAPEEEPAAAVMATA